MGKFGWRRIREAIGNGPPDSYREAMGPSILRQAQDKFPQGKLTQGKLLLDKKGK